MSPETNSVLDLIRNYADQAHGEQLRKYIPRRYIIHPVRVMKRCSQYTDDLVVLAAALLHDVLEDTNTSRDELLKFLETVTDAHTAERILNVVVELTDIYTIENFPNHSRRERKEMESRRLEHVSCEAQLIKYADIMDNTNEIIVCDPEFAVIYLHECMTFLHKMIKGNLQLYHLALQKVNNRIMKFNPLNILQDNNQAEWSVSAEI